MIKVCGFEEHKGTLRGARACEREERERERERARRVA